MNLLNILKKRELQKTAIKPQDQLLIDEIHQSSKEMEIAESYFNEAQSDSEIELAITMIQKAKQKYAVLTQKAKQVGFKYIDPLPFRNKKPVCISKERIL